MEFGIVTDLNIFQEVQTVKREDSRFVGTQFNTFLVQFLQLTLSSRSNMIDILQHVQKQAALGAIPRENAFSPMTPQSHNFLVHTEINDRSILNSDVAKTTQITMNTCVLQIHALHIERYTIENLPIHSLKEPTLMISFNLDTECAKSIRTGNFSHSEYKYTVERTIGIGLNSRGNRRRVVFQLSLFCNLFHRTMFTSNQLSTMRVVYKSVEMAEDLQSYIEELAKSVASIAYSQR